MGRKAHHHHRTGHNHDATAHPRPAGEGGPEIESIPWFGTTWYTGGPAYWLRRGLISLFMLAIFGVIAGIVWSFWGSILEGSGRGAPSLVAVGVLTGLNILGFVWTWRRMGPPPNAREIENDDRETFVLITALRILGWVVLILIAVGLVVGGATGRSVASLAAVILGFAFFGLATFLVGPTLAVFLRSISQQPPPIRLAREMLEARNINRGIGSP